MSWYGEGDLHNQGVRYLARGRRPLLIAAIVVLLVICAVGFWFWDRGIDQGRLSDPPIIGDGCPPWCLPISITAQELYDDRSANPAEFAEKYIFSPIVVTGQIVEIHDNGIVSLGIDRGEGLDTLGEHRVELRDMNPDDVIRLEVGQQMVARCEFPPSLTDERVAAELLAAGVLFLERCFPDN